VGVGVHRSNPRGDLALPGERFAKTQSIYLQVSAEVGCAPRVGVGAQTGRLEGGQELLA
jgi:hypothetical protein